MILLLGLALTILATVQARLCPKLSLQRLDLLRRKAMSGIVTAQRGAGHRAETALVATREGSTG
jgi:hypothetical protein